MIGFPNIANEMTKPTAHPYAPAAQNHRTEHDTFIRRTKWFPVFGNLGRKQNCSTGLSATNVCTNASHYRGTIKGTGADSVLFSFSHKIRPHASTGCVATRGGSCAGEMPFRAQL